MDEALIYIYIAILLLAGLLSTRLMKHFRLPNVTGYIITGIIFGPFVFGLIFNSNFDTIKNGPIFSIISKVGWVSQIALGFIAFSIGTSFRTTTLKAVGKKVVVITLFEALFASLIVLFVLLMAHFISPEVITIEMLLTLAAIASATAPAATLIVIKQYRAKGPIVDTLLPVVALDDAAALILFSILFQIATAVALGNEFNIYSMIAKPMIEIFISVGIGAGLGVIISYLNRFFKSRNNKLILCIFTVFAAVGFYVLFSSEYIGGGFELSSLLMCMMAGALFTNLAKDNDKTLDNYDRFTYPIYMMFFIFSGASLDLTIFASKNGLIVFIVALLYVIFRFLGKYFGAYLGTTITHQDKKIRKYLGFALAPQAGVAIGLATTACSIFQKTSDPKIKEVGNMILAVVLTSTLIYEITGPLLAKFALKKAGAITEE